MQKRIESLPAAAMRKLTRWHWPGNIRELQNFVERAVSMTRGSTLATSTGEHPSQTSGAQLIDVT
jgi:formate hydrogenlyase transcriptional activator